MVLGDDSPFDVVPAQSLDSFVRLIGCATLKRHPKTFSLALINEFNRNGNYGTSNYVADELRAAYTISPKTIDMNSKYALNGMLIGFARAQF